MQRLWRGAGVGICGSVHAVCLLAPDRAEELKAAMVARIGSYYGQEVRAAKQSTGAECVAAAAGLLEKKR